MMQTELNRLSTFANWPDNSSARPFRLARSGFSYSGNDDEVECFSCKLRLVQWRSYDLLQAMHKQKSPQCKDDKKNVPMEILTLSDMEFETDHAGCSAKKLINLMIIYRTSLSRATRNDVFSVEVEREEIPFIIDRLNPDFDLLRKEVVRLRTFHDWPPGAHAIPEVMAREGFFYIGVDDRVRCAFCRGYIFKWKPTDIPSDEHRKHFPDCLFVRGEEVGNVRKDPFNVDLSLATSRGRKQSHPREQLLQQMASLPIITEEARTTTSVTVTRANYPVEPREVKDRMDTAAVRAILDMGYSQESIRIVIENRLSTTRNDFPNVESLLEALFQLESQSISNSSTISHDRTMSTSSSSFSSLPSGSSSSILANSHPTYSPSPPVQNFQSLPLVIYQGTPTTPLSASDTADIAQTKSKGKRKRNKKTKNMSSPAHASVAESGSEGSSEADNTTSDEEATNYLEENRQLLEARTCKICMNAEVNTVFLPCGHLVCCNNCSPQLRNCPICRTFIRGTVKTYLS